MYSSTRDGGSTVAAGPVDNGQNMPGNRRAVAKHKSGKPPPRVSDRFRDKVLHVMEGEEDVMTMYLRLCNDTSPDHTVLQTSLSVPILQPVVASDMYARFNPRAAHTPTGCAAVYHYTDTTVRDQTFKTGTVIYPFNKVNLDIHSVDLDVEPGASGRYQGIGFEPKQLIIEYGWTEGSLFNSAVGFPKQDYADVEVVFGMIKDQLRFDEYIKANECTQQELFNRILGPVGHKDDMFRDSGWAFRRMPREYHDTSSLQKTQENGDRAGLTGIIKVLKRDTYRHRPYIKTDVASETLDGELEKTVATPEEIGSYRGSGKFSFGRELKPLIRRVEHMDTGSATTVFNVEGLQGGATPELQALGSVHRPYEKDIPFMFVRGCAMGRSSNFARLDTENSRSANDYLQFNCRMQLKWNDSFYN